MRTRRNLMIMMAPLALSGCGLFNGELFDDWFAIKKDPVPGKREAISVVQVRPDDTLTDTKPVVLPPVVKNPSWPQPGGDAAHAPGNLAGPTKLNVAWTANIGAGSGYRQRITAQPIVANGHVFTMDSNGTVCAFTLTDGKRVWRTDTQADDDRSTNVGGGLSFDAGVLYAATGRAELMAMDPAKGTIKWRVTLPTPARSGPTIADGKLYLPTVDSRMLAFAVANGKSLWSYDGSVAPTSVLGAPAPAFADGFLVAGFGGGDLVALRPDSGVVVWADNLGSLGGPNAGGDFSAVRGLPVIVDGRVFAIGLGGQAVELDLRSGRRLWTRSLAGANTPCVAGDTLFLATTDQTLMALARDDGGTRWSVALPRYENPAKQRDPITWFGPTLVNGQLVLMSSNNKLALVDAVSGKIGDLQDLPGPAQVAAVAANGTLLILSGDGTLAAYR